MRERIEKILEDKKITQAEFADFIGVNRSSITHIMTGRNKTSDTVVARTLLAFPDISPQWLSEGRGDMYKTVTESYTPTAHTYQNNETQMLEQDNLFDNTNRYIVENQQKKVEIPYQQAFPELDICPAADDSPAISASEQKENRNGNTAKIPIVNKQIRKIVFFYADKTFEEYYPEG